MFVSLLEISSVCEWRRIGYKSRKFTREITQHRLNRRKTCNLPPLFFSRPLRPPESLAIRTHFCCHPSIAIVMIIKHERIHFFTRCNRFQFSSLFFISFSFESMVRKLMSGKSWIIEQLSKSRSFSRMCDDDVGEKSQRGELYVRQWEFKLPTRCVFVCQKKKQQKQKKLLTFSLCVIF